MSREPGTLSIGWSRIGIELKQLLRDREAFVFTLALPMILMLVFGSVFGDQELGPTGITFAQYFVAGMIASGIVYTSFQNLAIGIPQERDEGTLKRLEGTPMPKAAYFLGKVGQVCVVYVLQLALLIAIGVLLFEVEVPSTAEQWAALAWLSILGLTTWTLLGLAFSSVPKSGKGASAVVTPIILVLQFTSGVFFAYDQLPSWMQQLAALFPLKWLTQGMRYVFLPDSAAALEVTGSFEMARVAMVLLVWTLLSALLAWGFFRWRRRGDG
ncbi:MAG: ABC transporter permease [Candidatus Nanopelagicales bacterium]|jgi:ABC-2 type transport system permease protein|nr:ABC transporter permease [Candidatus Nanopelagicales bacterium]